MLRVSPPALHPGAGSDAAKRHRAARKGKADALPNLSTGMARLQALKSKLATLPKSSIQTMQAGGWRTSTQTAHERGYDAAWRKRRAELLAEHPLCVYCLESGRAVPATVADHITPHHGDPVKFAGPLQALCQACHSGRKAREEQAAGLRTT